MRSQNLTKIENSEFVKRFTEVCGTSKPAEISRLLGVTYQAAKNYLQGRLPEAKVLRVISERTPYSIDWLLTGKGKKFARNTGKEDKEIFTDQMRAFVRQEILDVVNEVLGSQKEPVQQKVVVLQPKKVKVEKGNGKKIPLSVRRR